MLLIMYFYEVLMSYYILFMFKYKNKNNNENSPTLHNDIINDERKQNLKFHFQITKTDSKFKQLRNSNSHSI